MVYPMKKLYKMRNQSSQGWVYSIKHKGLYFHLYKFFSSDQRHEMAPQNVGRQRNARISHRCKNGERMGCFPVKPVKAVPNHRPKCRSVLGEVTWFSSTELIL